MDAEHGCRTRDAKHGMQYMGCRTQDAEHGIPNIGCRTRMPIADAKRGCQTRMPNTNTNYEINKI